MNLNQRLEPLPEFETGYSVRLDALLLAAVLAVGLTFVTPMLSVVLGVSTLPFVALTGIVYGILTLTMRRIIVGLFVGLTVTSTFAANVPLASQSYTAEVVGHLGPELWLANVPLAGVLAYLIVTIPEREQVLDLSRAEQIFGAFVVWSVLSAFFGAVVRFDVALYFSLMMFQALLVFIACRYAIQNEVFSFRTIVEVFTLVVCAQAAFGLVQLANGESFGLSFLGSGPNATVATFSLGPLGKIPIGTFISGFTGMSFQLAALIVLTAPVVLAFTIRSSGWRRWALIVVTFVLMIVLRATGTDAGRGGFIVALVLFAAAFGFLYKRGVLDLSISSITGRPLGHTVIPAIFTVFVTVVILFYPSSEAGLESNRTDINAGDGPVPSGSSGTTPPSKPESGVVESTLRELSIPFFDVSTLGIRLQQYVIGLELFIQSPVFGIGGANFAYVATAYGLPHPLPLHSMYFALLAETGLPGLVLYVATLVLVLWSGWQAVTADGSVNNRLLLVSVLSGMVGYLAFGFWDILPLIKITALFPFWILAGAVVGEYRRQSHSGENT
jgi:hypothetical protein